MKYFFKSSSWLMEHGLTDLGFKLYGKGHIIWLLAILIFVIVMCLVYKNKAGNRSGIRKFFAVAILLSEIFKDVMLIITGAPMMAYLPFHICSLAIFAMVFDAFVPKQKLTGQMMAYIFMPGAVCAELFCNWTEYPLFSFMNIFSFVFHGWIIAYFWMQYVAGEIRPNYKGMWMTILTVGIIGIPVFMFDVKYNENYMFLNWASEGSPLVKVWEIFGTRFGHPGYIFGYALLATVVLHILCFLYGYKIKIVKR